jgi:hypothetical protein
MFAEKDVSLNSVFCRRTIRANDAKRNDNKKKTFQAADFGL